MKPRTETLFSGLLGLAAWLVAIAWQGCEFKADHGERCIRETDCAEGLVCAALFCRTPGDARQIEALQEQILQQQQQSNALAQQFKEQQLLAQAAAEQVKEQRLLAQSGVEPAKGAERPPETSPEPSPPGTASIGRVRVSRTEGQPPIFAACRDDEQLVGGGCRALDLYSTVSQSFPVHFDPLSTRGARWACDARSKHVKKQIEAYALCQAIGPP
jgi:hypothetical protein